MFRVKKNDQVVVLAGKDRGKRGKVLRLFPEDGKILVEGLNLVKKHLRRSQSNPQGAILSRETPVAQDKVQPVCPKCGRGVRVGFRSQADGSKVRVCAKCKVSF